MNSSGRLECAKTAGSTIRTGKFEVNLDKRLVTVDSDPVHLSPKEYEILELLSSRKGTIVTKEMFLNRLYGDGHEPGHKIIDIFVCKLRQKLTRATGGPHCIGTVWGRGYVLREAGIRLGQRQRRLASKLPKNRH
jgi:two-component system cell cycle response regulator CtrA